MIYNKHEWQDVLNILIALDGFADGTKEDFQVSEINVDTGAVESAVLGMRNDFPHVDGVEQASAFKKVANFIVHFICCQPIGGFEFVNDIDQHHLFHNSCPLTKFDPNAVFAVHFAVELLKGVVIDGANCGPMTIEHEIALSMHSYNDLLDALSSLDVKPKEHFSLVSLLLEQLVYKTNKECQYKEYACGPDWYWDEGARVGHYTDDVEE